MEAQWSQAISKNPFLGLKIRGAKVGDRIAVSWSDNKGQQGSIETTIAAGN
jgi:sulfur-oxidizing protein SoxZ